MHIDDFFHTGTAEFDTKIMDKLRSRFIPGKVEESNFRYIGFSIEQTDSTVRLRHDDFISKLVAPSISAARSEEKSSSLTQDESIALRSAVGDLNL